MREQSTIGRGTILFGVLLGTAGGAFAQVADVGTSASLSATPGQPSPLCADPGAPLPAVLLTWNNGSCQGAVNSIIYSESSTLEQTASSTAQNGSSPGCSDPNATSGPQQGTTTYPAIYGEKVESVVTFYCAGNTSTSVTPVCSDTQTLVTNSVAFAPYLCQSLIASPDAGELILPTNVPLGSHLGPMLTLGANPAGGEQVVVSVSGPGLSFNRTYPTSAWPPSDLDGPGGLMSFQAGENQMTATLEPEGLQSNVLQFKTVKTPVACQPCRSDSDCTLTTSLGILGGLSCVQGMCNAGGNCSLLAANPDAGVCPTYDDSGKCAGICGANACDPASQNCVCPGAQSGAGGRSSGSASGCGMSGGAGGVELFSLVAALLAVARGRRRRGQPGWR